MQMSVKFSPNAVEQMIYLADHDKRRWKEFKKILADTQRNGADGLGRPEVLTGNWLGWWSKRLNDEDRMIFRVIGDVVEVALCYTHYGDK